jgi:hypothetical protein
MRINAFLALEAKLALDAKVILTPPCKLSKVIHQRFSIQNIQGRVKMTSMSTPKANGEEDERVGRHRCHHHHPGGFHAAPGGGRLGAAFARPWRL